MYKATNISTCEQIHASLTEIQPFIEAHYNADNPNAVVERSNVLESYMALSGKLLADAQYHYDSFLNSEIIKAVKEGFNEKLSPSSMNKYIDSLAKDYKYLVVWAERVNRTCTHQIELSRTIISKLKAEIYQLQSR